MVALLFSLALFAGLAALGAWLMWVSFVAMIDEWRFERSVRNDLRKLR